MEKLNKREKILVGTLVLGIILLLLINYYLKEKNSEQIFLEENSIVEENNLDEKNIEEPTEIMVHISGAIKNPGIVTISQGQRLVDVIDLVGGLNDGADIEKINLARRVKDEEKIHIPYEGEEVVFEEESVGIDINDEGKININTCNKEALMTLPGIGEKTSEKILEYRENNVFSKINDIMEVSGIGEKKFQAIKDLITVN